MDYNITDKVFLMGEGAQVPVSEVGYHDFRYLQECTNTRTQNFYTLHMVVGGEGVYNIGGKTYDLGGGNIFVTPEGIPFSYYPKPDNPWRYFWFGIKDINVIDGLKTMGLWEEVFVLKLKQADKVCQALFGHVIKSNEATIQYDSAAAFYTVLSAIAAEKVSKKTVTPINLPEYYVSKAEGLIEANLTNSQFGVAVLSNIMAISPSYLSRMFRAVTGETVSERIIKLRYELAAELLTSTPLSIREVSYRCGVGDEIHFYKQFKKIYSMTAGEYRAAFSSKLSKKP